MCLRVIRGLIYPLKWEFLSPLLNRKTLVVLWSFLRKVVKCLCATRSKICLIYSQWVSIFDWCILALSGHVVLDLRIVISHPVVAERLNLWRLTFFSEEIMRKQLLLDMLRELIIYVSKVVISFARVATHTAELAFLAWRKPFHLF